MPHKALTHKDLSKQLGISETTIKSYRRKFPGCIPVACQGRPIRFNAEALAVCKRIRDFFDLGMNIPDIRLRLSAEFPWISPEAPLCPPNGDVDDTPPVAAEALPTPPPTAPSFFKVEDALEGDHSLPLIVGNLAKSLISLSRQQSALLKRLEGLETRMEAALHGRPGQVKPAASAPASEDDARLENKLEGIERTLEQTMDLLGDYVEAVQGLVRASPATDNEAAPEGEAPLESVAAYAATSQGPVPAKGRTRKFSEEYLRGLAGLPLMYKNADGEFAHLGDRSRGAYTLNDLKAVFAQAYSPPEHYIAYWHMEGEQSWFVLEQPESLRGRPLFLLVRSLRDARGAELALLENLIVSGEEEAPSALYPIIEELLG